MATANELRTTIQENQQALQAAISSAEARWEVGSGDERWSPRQTAEHAIGAELTFVGWIATAIQGKAPEPQELSLATAADASAALTNCIADCQKLLRYVEDRDLEKAASMPEGVPFPNTIAGVMQLSAYHLGDHAQQISNA